METLGLVLVLGFVPVLLMAAVVVWRRFGRMSQLGVTRRSSAGDEWGGDFGVSSDDSWSSGGDGGSSGGDGGCFGGDGGSFGGDSGGGGCGGG